MNEYESNKELYYYSKSVLQITKRYNNNKYKNFQKRNPQKNVSFYFWRSLD